MQALAPFVPVILIIDIGLAFILRLFPSNLAGNESKLKGDASIGILTPLEFSCFKGTGSTN